MCVCVCRLCLRSSSLLGKAAGSRSSNVPRLSGLCISYRRSTTHLSMYGIILLVKGALGKHQNPWTMDVSNLLELSRDRPSISHHRGLQAVPDSHGGKKEIHLRLRSRPQVNEHMPRTSANCPMEEMMISGSSLSRFVKNDPLSEVAGLSVVS